MSWTDLLVFVTPLLLWASAVYGRGYLRTSRHRLSGLLAVVAGALLFASFHAGSAGSPGLLFSAGCVAMGAMIVTLLWPPT